MATSLPSLLLCFFFFSFLSVTLSVHTKPFDQPKTYIIHASKSEKPATFSSHHRWYSSIVNSVSSSHQPSDILYTYERSVNGFSARLTRAQAAQLRRLPGILSVIPDRPRKLHTTHTPTFLGLADGFGLWPNAEYGDDVIVGVLDTGIWPERPSFSDEGLPPVPSTWKGTCEATADFPSTACNRKIIGARAFYRGYTASLGSRLNETGGSLSPRDTEGHGTHTASTAAGAVVKDAGFYEYARGEARGMAVKARIAVYKICWSEGCYDSDILAAMDQAIDDGVHIISLSVGASGYAPAYYRDSIAIGAFGAMQHGILVSCSAGNSGPEAYTAVNIAPWILTVGASTIDREFPADVVLGDGRLYGGVSLYSGEGLGDAQYPLVYAANCGSRYCYTGQLNSTLVAGKIVICDRGGNARVEKGSAVKIAGGVGMIHANTDENGEELLADSHLLPATMVGAEGSDKIREYVKSDPSPTATIVFRGTVIGTSPSAPRIASFSSRGPNHLTAEIIKPDVTAPGVNILAGWTGYTSPTDLDTDSRRVDFNIISGTSMSCPHVSGLAALLRRAHSTWTPAAIKSALMTTAYYLDNKGEKITDLATGEQSTPFVHGSGHVDPNRALNPGLVYDTGVDDYVAFLCAIGYDSKKIATFVKDPVDCSAGKFSSPGDLNYPSFSVAFDSNKGGVVKYKRVVKNVGSDVDAVYEVSVSAPAGVEVVVSPEKLEFSEEKTEVGYEITFSSAGGRKAAFGAIEWSDGSHNVRSPIAVVWGASTWQMSM
ncbi:subtilisin-like protease SBT1.4 [Cynara cardunculus var. scolymus]|uniref:Peptidase S8/S53 domain-containing protein n=1 Tax=Cynara cardunculus var. scolymus TaxID=59895 RepID=A0A103XLF9_CYNCS|nr:subtilisin-like protease SBT1.4 [Cynara cardunculus var. scolymus]KVH92898.1 Peptidase S8/S53 domain-containing protein [Cynara cardunculus var. scolymus]